MIFNVQYACRLAKALAVIEQLRPHPPIVCVSGAQRRSLFQRVSTCNCTDYAHRSGRKNLKLHVQEPKKNTPSGRELFSSMLYAVSPVHCSQIKWPTEEYSQKTHCFKAHTKDGAASKNRSGSHASPLYNRLHCLGSTRSPCMIT